MRLRACIALTLLGASGCAQLPGLVRLEVDERTIEIRQNGFDPAFLRGDWSLDPDCPSGSGEAMEMAGHQTRVRRLGPDEIELPRPDGRVLRLYRCSGD